ncbi:tigger transposable element-derived protein 6 [Trichonephila clavipes]|nr:tigger transposable element-derived protein 6 [Trichonephila clavipes]
MEMARGLQVARKWSPGHKINVKQVVLSPGSLHSTLVSRIRTVSEGVWDLSRAQQFAALEERQRSIVETQAWYRKAVKLTLRLRDKKNVLREKKAALHREMEVETCLAKALEAKVENASERHTDLCPIHMALDMWSQNGCVGIGLVLKERIVFKTESEGAVGALFGEPGGRASETEAAARETVQHGKGGRDGSREGSFALIIFDKAWRVVTPLTIHSCFKRSCLSSPNLVDVDDTLTEFNAEPSLWETLPEHDLTFDNYVLVDTDIAVWGALSDAEIVTLDHNNTESDEDESGELTPVTLSEAKVSLNKLRNFSLQNHVDEDILQASFVLEKSIDRVRLNALKQKKITDFFHKKY